MVPSTLRTGFGDGNEGDAALEGTLRTVGALMRCFTKEACDVACRYVHGRGRNVVGADDMRRALMYVARTFFETADDDLFRRVEEELHEDGNEEGDASEDGDDDGDTSEDGGEDGDASEHGGEDGDALPWPPPCTDEERAFAQTIDAMAETWDEWAPDDPVYAMLKRAIDATRPLTTCSA